MEKKKKNEEISVMFLSIVCWLKKYFGYTGLNILLKLKKKNKTVTQRAIYLEMFNALHVFQPQCLTPHHFVKMLHGLTQLPS